jgi:hypothetical protein
MAVMRTCGVTVVPVFRNYKFFRYLQKINFVKVVYFCTKSNATIWLPREIDIFISV